MSIIWPNVPSIPPRSGLGKGERSVVAAGDNLVVDICVNTLFLLSLVLLQRH